MQRLIYQQSDSDNGWGNCAPGSLATNSLADLRSLELIPFQSYEAVDFADDTRTIAALFERRDDEENHALQKSSHPYRAIGNRHSDEVHSWFSLVL